MILQGFCLTLAFLWHFQGMGSDDGEVRKSGVGLNENTAQVNCLNHNWISYIGVFKVLVSSGISLAIYDRGIHL